MSTTIYPTEDVIVFVQSGVAYVYVKEGKKITVAVYDDDNAVETSGEHYNMLDIQGYELDMTPRRRENIT